MLYSGWDGNGEFFYSMEILYGGIPGRPIGDGMDGHSWWPLFENIPTEYLEAYYPLRIDGYTTVTDSGGAGLHRGGNGVEKRYVYLEPGEVSIHDDRWLTRPVGRARRPAGRALGEDPAARRRHRGAAAVEVRQRRGRAGRHARLPHGGRRRLEGPPRPAGRGRRPRRLLRARLAREGAGGLRRRARRATGRADEAATEAERARQRDERGEALAFDFGPSLEEVLANCKAETGLEPPTPAKPLRWSPLEPAERRARPRPRRATGSPAPSRASISPGFGERQGAGRRPPCS